jgi:hypothetical protein
VPPVGRVVELGSVGRTPFMKALSKNLGVALLLISVCLGACGCGTIIGGAFDAWSHENRVDSYRDRGFSERAARQNATDDSLLEDMEDLFSDD